MGACTSISPAAWDGKPASCSPGPNSGLFGRATSAPWPTSSPTTPLDSGHIDQTGPVLAAYAAVAVLILSGINILGVREGKWTQNLLTAVKVLGLAAVVVAGFCFAAPAAGNGSGNGDRNAVRPDGLPASP